MKWLDFSAFNSTLTLRKKGNGTPESLFVVKPIVGQFIPNVKKAFITRGFSEDGRGFLVAPSNPQMAATLFALKSPKIKEIEVDLEDILDKSTMSVNNNLDINNKIGAKNEYRGNEKPSNPSLEGVLPSALSSDEPVEHPIEGSGSGSDTDSERNDDTQDVGDDRIGSVAGVESLVSADEAERRVSDDDELSTDAPAPFEISDDIHLGEGTRSAKLRGNLAAIRLIRLLEKEERSPTESEKLELVKFVGWGGLKSVFNPQSKAKQDNLALEELKILLSKEEMQWALNGVLAQHFTSEEVVASLYKVVDHMGFSGGNVIEPTLGIGSFIGLMPEHLRSASHWYGAEIDPIPGKIAQYLYPEATILAGKGFQDAEFQYEKFDMAIGNPPFGDERITDNNAFRADINRFKIHNYIIAKSAMHLKVGGILPMVVTHRFLDAKNDEARAFLAKHFDLLTAIRLPNNAFKKNAGTEVVTDLIFFKRRDPEQEPGNLDWLNNSALLSTDDDGQEIRINEFFVNNPELMLGTPSMSGKMYAGYGEKRNEFTLNPFDDKTIAEQIDALIAGPLAPLKDVLRGSAEAQAKQPILFNSEDISVGGYRLENNTIWYREEDDAYGNSVIVKLSPDTPWTEKTVLGNTRYERIKGMLQIRNTGYELIAAERQNKFNIEDLRVELNERYDEFVERFGYINDPANSSLMNGDIRIEFGMEKNYKNAISAVKAKKRNVERAGSIAEKADILLHRVFYPDRNVLHASSPSDAYNISLSERGFIDYDYMSEITGQTISEIQHELSTLELPLIFKDPITDSWIQEDEYLSGNVKEKFAEALAAGDEFGINVEALRRVLPKDVLIKDIFVDIGQTWIPRDVYEQFLVELGYPNPSVHISHQLGTVTLNLRSGGQFFPGELAGSIENEIIGVGEMFNAIANKKNVIIYRKDGSGNPSVDHDKTRQANIFTKKMGSIFSDWVFADNLRANRLEEIYNRTQNTTVARKFNGHHLHLHDNNPSIVLRDTQKKGAWRMIQSSSTLLDHVVGAGKTYTIIAGVMERKRLGLSNKSCITVPNHLVRQWAVDFVGMYPGANIFTASEADFSKKNRKKMFAKIATGNFDAIIIGHSSLKFMPLDKSVEASLISDETETLERALSDAESNENRRAVRTISNQLAKRREKIKALNNAPKDDVATFNDMGIDYLVVDESHMFKNLEYATGMNQVAGMGNPTGSQRAFDLYLKIRSLEKTGGGVAFATGTPLSNSLVEAYGIMRYLNPEGLALRKLNSFDAWVKNYALIENKIEYTSTNTLKERTIMSKFNNIPEMMQIYNQFADVVSKRDLLASYANQIKVYNEKNGTQLREEFPIPKVKLGGRQLVTTDASSDQREYMDYLIERSYKMEKDREQGKYDPKMDNALWIYGDAKKAALDIRVVDPLADDYEGSKVNLMIKDIIAIYHEWMVDKGTQLVFCDLSTPSKHAGKKANALIKLACSAIKFDPSHLSDLSYQGRWSLLADAIHHELELETTTDARREQLEAVIGAVESDIGALIAADTGFSIYDDVKKKLISAGIPEGEIQFIHDFDKAQDKKELFDMVNSGTVRILLGSTSKMGMGTNVQERIVHLHHLDKAMHNRPDDIEQREGRPVRQGNKLYERDPDGFEVGITAYSTERTFDAVSWQILARKALMIEGFRSGARTIDESNSDSATYLEFMAETTGNPIFREKIKLEKEIEELESEERRVTSRLSSARYTVDRKDIMIGRAEKRIAAHENALRAIGDSPVIEWRGEKYKVDYEALLEKEKPLYFVEKEQHRKAISVYEKAFAAWMMKPIKERGEKPIKPQAPDNPESINSVRMQKSEQFRFVRDVIDAIPRNYNVKFSVGELVYTLNKQLNPKNSEEMIYSISNNLGFMVENNFISNPLDDIKSTTALFDGLIKSADIGRIKKSLDKVTLELDAINKEATYAEGILKAGAFTHADELKEKVERYQVVQEVVKDIEVSERERRLSSGNRYMERDFIRFPDYSTPHKEEDSTIVMQL